MLDKIDQTTSVFGFGHPKSPVRFIVRSAHIRIRESTTDYLREPFDHRNVSRGGSASANPLETKRRSSSVDILFRH